MNPERRLVPFGRGSFATVSILSGRPVAFKHVIAREHSLELKSEFQVIRSLYDFCDADSFFAIPRPLPFYDLQSPPVQVSFRGWLSYSIRVTLTPCPLSSKQSRFQVAGIEYRRVRDGSGLTYSAIDHENDTHTMSYPPNTLTRRTTPWTSTLCRLLFW